MRFYFLQTIYSKEQGGVITENEVNYEIQNHTNGNN
jgi:hypothetical protein